MVQTNNIDMVIDPVDDLFKTRTLSLSLSECDEDYITRVQRKSDKMVKNDLVALSDSIQLEYVTLKSHGNQVSKAADLTSNTKQ